MLCDAARRGRATASHPAIRRVLMTGYELDAPELSGDRSAAERLVQKPWDVGELMSMCRELLQKGD